MSEFLHVFMTVANPEFHSQRQVGFIKLWIWSASANEIASYLTIVGHSPSWDWYIIDTFIGKHLHLYSEEALFILKTKQYQGIIYVQSQFSYEPLIYIFDYIILIRSNFQENTQLL